MEVLAIVPPIFMIPKIIIQHSPYLDEIYKAWIHSIPRYKDWVFPIETDVREKARIFAETWDDIGEGILSQVCEHVGLTFKRNHIPIYIVSSNTRTFSNPIVIRSGYSVDEFVELLVHELIHCLFVDNAESSFVKNIDKFDDHVVLYAVLEAVIPGTVVRKTDVLNFPVNEKYYRAKEYVKENGYLGILVKCKEPI